MCAHRQFVCDMLDDDGITARFAEGGRLPRRYGVGLDERVVEYPWVMSRGLSGRMLDAGSTLNHAHVLDRVLPRVESLHIVTLAPEAEAFVDRGVSYIFADLRDLPYRDGYFDTVASLSTLEHVGMDNSSYGASSGPAPDPVAESLAAVSELRRVLRPGGRILVTVPYGRRESFGWFRQFDERDVAVLAQALGGDTSSVTVYAYARDGWQPSSLRAAARVSYAEGTDRSPASDRAAAARAVACLDVTGPA